MTKALKTVRVQEVPGEKMVFRVESWSEPHPHRVELLAHAGFGECSCRQWQCRVSPAIKAGGSWYDPRTFCRHVLAARQFFLGRLLTHMALDNDLGKPRA